MTAQKSQNFLDAEQAYYDNADYSELNSRTKARAFVTACRRLIGLLPREFQHGQESTSFDLATLQRELDTAQSFVSRPASQVGFFEFCRE